ncbi:MAG: DUF503 domain-containing protein [Firmicutes bacterium HGW-Firmicutes-13]|nr:MAG: DUF503 domain-containing protein [Firmicutes bacterium HGW-Firmicutes-13]
MIIGICRIEIFLPNSQSLKEKRRVLKSLIQKLRQKFNISIAEIENQDKWQKTTLAIVCVSSSSRFVNKVIEQILNEIEKFNDGHVINYDIEII